MISPVSQAAAFRAAAVAPPEILDEACAAAEGRGVALAYILQYELGVPRERLLEALAAFYNCESISFDERVPIPPELITAVPKDKPASEGWFPVLKRRDGTVVVAALDPRAPGLVESLRNTLGEGNYEFRVTLPHDIASLVKDFLHAPPGKIVGTERTGLAWWRNIMAQWRTRMACYRTDMAKARTGLAVIRAGLALTAIANTLVRSHRIAPDSLTNLTTITLGLALMLIGTPIYLRVRRSRLTPPREQTLVEVTRATLLFLEDYHDQVKTPPPETPGQTMLSRLGDLLGEHSTIIAPMVPESRERTTLARERNVLAAQRTIAGCYRTIYARARTGLAFIRTGIAFLGGGFGLLYHFGFGVNTPFDILVMIAGTLMIADGLYWYLPVRREQAGLPHSRSGLLGA